jgi:hypothetical protein
MWFLLIAIIATASVVSAAFVVPGLLRSVLFSSRPDFALKASPASSVMLTGNEEDLVVSVQSLDNFSGIVSLKAISSASDLNIALLSYAGISPDAIPLGHVQNLTLSIRAFSWGNYTITLIATSGQLFHSTKVFVVVQSIVFSATPAAITLPQGSTASSQIVFSSRNGLSGNISLTTSIYHPGEINPGLQATVSPSWVVLSSSGTVTVTLTIQASSSAQSWLVGFSACPVNFPTLNGGDTSMCVGHNFDVIIS